MPEVVRRYRSFQVKTRAAGAEDDGAIGFVASTQEAVNWGSFREVLVHTAEAVDVSACTALLINHDINQLAGPLRSIAFADGQCSMGAEVLASAKMESDVPVREAITSGALRGISVSYNYFPEDTTWDDQSRTLTVHKWRMLEASLTPTPADTGASLRSLPTKAARSADPTPPDKERNMDFSAWLKARGFDESKVAASELVILRALHAEKQEIPEGYAAHARTVVDPPKVDKAADETQRAALMVEQREIAALAKSVGLDAADYVGMRKAEAQTKMLTDAAAKRGTAGQPEQTPIIISSDAADKARDAFTSATLHRVGFKQEAASIAGNPFLGRTVLDQARAYLNMVGCRGAQNWDRRDLARFILGRTSEINGFRDAANISVASFPSFVMLNAISKSVAAGFEMGSSSIKHQAIVSRKSVPDFKTFYIGGLGTGNLQKTAENVAFPELNKAEGAYSDTAKMWGGTLSLSFQALINDDVGEFDRGLRNAGLIALKTIDKRVFQKLLMGTSAAEATSTWTSNTTSGCTPVYTTGDTIAAARANIGKASMAMMSKLGLDGNPLGNSARHLIAGPTAGQYLLGLKEATGGQVVGNGAGAIPDVVITPWLEFTGLTGYSTTSYYALADANEVTGLVLSTITGMESPQVQEYDAGAVAARNWKIFMPFEADLFWYTGTDGSTKVVPGAQQATT